MGRTLEGRMWGEADDTPGHNITRHGGVFDPFLFRLSPDDEAAALRIRFSGTMWYV